MRPALALLIIATLLLGLIRLVRWRLGHFDARADCPSVFITDEELEAERAWLGGGEMPSRPARLISNEGRN